MSLARRAVLAVSAAVLLYSQVGASQPTVRDPHAAQETALNALQQRLHSLQDELTRLHEEIARVQDQLEQIHAEAALTTPKPIDARATPEAATAAGAAAVASTSGDESSTCTPPFTVDASGIKRFRTECLARLNCDVPYVVEAGIKRIRPECVSRTQLAGTDAADSCSPPYVIADDGIKRIKHECM